MSKLVQAFLSGLFFTFFLDFFIFLGVKLHYIDFYEINVYYNILFWDNQNMFIYFIFTMLIGYLVIYVNSNKIKLTIIGTLFLLSFSTLIQPIGYLVAEMMFKQKNKTFQEGKYSYTGDVYYNGRKEITLYDYKLDKIILLKKKDLK
jgi:hypothetical protein